MVGIGPDDLKPRRNVPGIVAALRPFGEVEELDLGADTGLRRRAALREQDFKVMAELVKIRRLDVEGFTFPDAALSHLGSLPALRELDLSGTSLTDDGLEIHSSLPHLESLNVNDTSVTDAGLLTLGRCRSLKQVRLRGAKVSAEAVEKLKAMCVMVYGPDRGDG